MERIALLPPRERDEALDGLDPEQVLWDWLAWGRPEQFAPPGEWNIWLAVAGRGWGKTRCGAEWVREKAREHPGCRFFFVARTAADVRDVMIQGESGVVAISPPSERPVWHPSNRSLTWPNGSTALAFSSEEPNQLRGPQSHFTWADEAAAWKFTPDDSGLNAWDNVRVATRLGELPQILATTTPKRTPFMSSMLEEATSKPEVVVVTRGTTYDNLANLSANYLDFITGRYEGTHMARQELLGMMLEDIEGALWTQEVIDDARVDLVSASLPLRVVAVDPSVAEDPTDECGIVVVGATPERQLHQRQAYVLEDASLRGSPEVWVKEVVRLAKKWRCPIVAEKNQGHALISLAIKNLDTRATVLPVWSQVGKKLRAEPVMLAYEQGRVHHVGYLGELETQLTTWVPGETRKSPDRLDALVHGVTALMILPPRGLGGGRMRSTSPAHRQLPTGRGTGLGARQVAGRRAA